MEKITFLTKDQVFGDDKIDIIKQYGSKCSITDFAILLDGFVLNNTFTGGFSLDKRTGMWFTSSFYDENNAFIVDNRGCKSVISNIKRQCGGRPVLLWDFLSFHYQNNIYEIKYGEYPQNIVGFKENTVLESLYKQGLLNEKDKTYTIDQPHNSYSNAKFMAREFTQYEYNNQKYIRFVTGNSYCNGNVLSDGSKIIPNSVYWIKVEPITWIMDINNGMMLSKNILFAGIQFNNYDKINTNFIESDIYSFLNEIFIKDIESTYSNNKQLVKIK